MVDDEAVLDATSGFLESLGYDAVAFSSGAAFLASDAFLAAEAADRAAGLLNDVDMPGLNGLELQERVRRLRPALPIITRPLSRSATRSWFSPAAVGDRSSA